MEHIVKVGSDEVSGERWQPITSMLIHAICRYYESDIHKVYSCQLRKNMDDIPTDMHCSSTLEYDILHCSLFCKTAQGSTSITFNT